MISILLESLSESIHLINNLTIFFLKKLHFSIKRKSPKNIETKVPNLSFIAKVTYLKVYYKNNTNPPVTNKIVGLSSKFLFVIKKNLMEFCI